MPPSNTGQVYFPITDQMVGPIRPSLLLLLGAVTCVLLIACTMGFTLTLSVITDIGLGFLTSFRRPHADLRSSLTGHNRGTVDAAAFWLAGQASDHLKISMPSVSNDLTDLRKEAVFAPTQSEDDGVPMLIHIAQTHSNVQVRAQAIFRLGQHADHPEVIEVLKRLALE